jgi:hypothetical protein
MKLLLLGTVLLLTATAARADVHVRGCTRRDGTSVSPHTRCSPRQPIPWVTPTRPARPRRGAPSANGTHSAPSPAGPHAGSPGSGDAARLGRPRHAAGASTGTLPGAGGTTSIGGGARAGSGH